MTNLAFTMVQRNRLTAETPAEQGIRAARFAAAKSTEETSECRALEEATICIAHHAGKGQNIKHPLNYLWAIAMGRQM